MPRRKALDVTFADGSVLNLSKREYWNCVHLWQLRVKPLSFAMVGKWHVATGECDLAVHTEPNPPQAFWEASWQDESNRAGYRRMRLGIVADIERDAAPFSQHPLFAELAAAIAAERAGWGYDPVTEPEYSNRSPGGLRHAV